jgi:hypothetical protein
MKLRHLTLGPVALVVVFALAAYFQSWWLVLCSFVFTLIWAVREFAEVKDRLEQVETKLGISSDTDSL